MGKEGGHRPAGLSETGMTEKRSLAVADAEVGVAETAHARDILCDCHAQPMYYFPVALRHDDDFVMCWVGECGRSYNRSLGYFHLCAGRRTGERMQEKTRRRTHCPKADCSTYSLMAVTRSCYASPAAGSTCWYCFACATEFAAPQVPSFRARLMRSLNLLSSRKPSVTHTLEGAQISSRKGLPETLSL